MTRATRRIRANNSTFNSITACHRWKNTLMKSTGGGLS
jgi:hypothetical protein